MIGLGVALTVEDLARLDLFADLRLEDLNRLAVEATVEQYNRKQTILPADSDHDGIVVISGGARLFRLARKGVDVSIAMLGPGDSYLLAAAAPAVRCVCVLEASEDDTTIYRLPAGQLRDLVSRNPGLSDRVLTIAAQTVTMLADRLEDLVANDVRTRLAHALAAMNPRSDEPIEVTHQELAALIGTSQTQVTKALAHLRRTGLVASEHHRRGIVVLDRSRLKRYGEIGA